MWYTQLKWGLTFNTFTQPQSISHFSSTRPQWELLKRDVNSKSLISHRAGVNPAGLPWVSDTQTHTQCTYMHTYVDISAHTVLSELPWQVTKSFGELHPCNHSQSSPKNCWTSSPSPAIPLNPASLKGTMGEMFGLWRGWVGPLRALLWDRMQCISVKPQRRIKLTQRHCYGLAISFCHATLGPTWKKVGNN